MQERSALVALVAEKFHRCEQRNMQNFLGKSTPEVAKLFAVYLISYALL